MTAVLDPALVPGSTIVLILALFVACAFEFVNGFHDTANAVATVIYTRTLRPHVAVLLSGLCNFLGVFVGGIGVAMAIIKLLPVELVVAGPERGMAMVGALLIAAVLWNLGTWYLGLPASSSHTLIGAILGVGIANSALEGHFGAGVNWGKASDVGISLLVSPLVGFAVAGGLLLLSRRLIKDERIFLPPDGTREPPRWVRAILIATCSGVSFAHGSNDGQKGVGLIMLILVCLAPAAYALDPSASAGTIAQTREAAVVMERILHHHHACGPTEADEPACDALRHLASVQAALAERTAVQSIDPELRWKVRQDIIRVDRALKKLEKELDPAEIKALEAVRPQLARLTEYAPLWVLFVVALSLGVGTTVGWKRIVVTVGEKIGKSHLTYAQGASAELVAMSTIGLSSLLGLPVSTTHVLSSGIAGTMVVERSGLQLATVRNVALAWIFTLPASMLLSGLLFCLFQAVL
jgi:phosphate/sulfate permease